ncbi:flagellar assembly protein FliW [Anoxynatronum sibiricum]|uniref:Flagellar assembly factor FliW n=1 Tax=Anoxynatronum sibiricum TaxID=210623 RepID=A0ABU9VUH9_9CLOT
MQLETKHFGTITIDEAKILTFPDGIPGFEEKTRFALVQNPEPEVPFHWLQSVEEEGLTFVVTNPFLIRFNYDFDLPEHVVKKLAIQGQEDVQIFCIVRIPEKVQEMTINLTAPIVLNTRTLMGKQVVLEDDRYHTRHLVQEELAASKQLMEAAKAADTSTPEAVAAVPETPAEGGR